MRYVVRAQVPGVLLPGRGCDRPRASRSALGGGWFCVRTVPLSLRCQVDEMVLHLVRSAVFGGPAPLSYLARVVTGRVLLPVPTVMFGWSCIIQVFVLVRDNSYFAK